MIQPRPSESGVATRAAPGLADADAEAMGRLCDRTGADLYALALRIIGSAAEAEEVVEQTLLEAWSAGDPAAAHAALLARRCRSLALVRSGKRSIESTRRAPASAGLQPLGDRARTAAARALGQLSASDARLAAMACFEGYSVAEIAARTDSGPSEVLAGLARILDALQEEDGALAIQGGRLEPAGLEEACVLHAFDLLESDEYQRFARRLQAGEAALAARRSARECQAALLALSAPPARPAPALRMRLVRAAAGGPRA